MFLRVEHRNDNNGNNNNNIDNKKNNNNINNDNNKYLCKKIDFPIVMILILLLADYFAFRNL